MYREESGCRSEWHCLYYFMNAWSSASAMPLCVRTWDRKALMSLSSAAVSLICFSVESWTAVSAPVSLHAVVAGTSPGRTQRSVLAEDQWR